MMLADLADFVQCHGDCGTLTGGATSPTPHGYLVRVTCSCGVVFERWVAPIDGEIDLALHRLHQARLN
jgi:hypothetical protein